MGSFSSAILSSTCPTSRCQFAASAVGLGTALPWYKSAVQEKARVGSAGLDRKSGRGDTVTLRSDRGYVGVLAYNPVHGDYNTVYPRTDPYDLAELARALPANWRRPSKPADLATAPGRNCAMFAALCKLALGGSDEGLRTWARTLNSEFAVPLPESEVRGIWRSVCRYRARWRVQGHQQGWLWKQAARGRKGGLIGGLRSGVVRRAGTPLEHDRAPWADLGVSTNSVFSARPSSRLAA